MRDLAFYPDVWSQDDAHWTVQEGPINNGCVNLVTHVATVPYPYTSVQEHIRMHEAMHICCTPIPGKPVSITERMWEELRIDSMSNQDWMDVTHGHDLVDVQHWTGKQELRPREAALALLQFTSTQYDNEKLDQGVFAFDEQRNQPLQELMLTWWGTLSTQESDWLQEAMLTVWQDTSLTARNRAIAEFDLLFPADPPAVGDFSDHQQGTVTEQKWVTMQQLDITADGSCIGQESPIPVLLDKVSDADGKDLGWFLNQDSWLQAHQLEGQLKNQITAKQQQLALQHQTMLERGDRAHRGLSARDQERDRKIIGSTLQVGERGDNGAMLIKTVVMPRNATRTIQRPGGNASKGEQLTQITRWWADRRIFRASRPGGTAVIDVSGSMDWDWLALRAAIEEMPAATIGMYSGLRSTGSRKGQLVIIAQGGRWCDPATVMANLNFYQGNYVDIEVLQWLAKQAQPRVWLGDGQVHSGLVRKLMQEYGHAKTEAFFATLCQRGKIVRARTVDDALAYMRSGGRRGAGNVLNWDSTELITPKLGSI